MKLLDVDGPPPPLAPIVAAVAAIGQLAITTEAQTAIRMRRQESIGHDPRAQGGQAYFRLGAQHDQHIWYDRRPPAPVRWRIRRDVAKAARAAFVRGHAGQEFVGEPCDDLRRDTKRLHTRLRFAGLRVQATPEDVDYRAARGLDVFDEHRVARRNRQFRFRLMSDEVEEL